MRVSRLLLFLLFGVAIAVAGCARGPMIAVPMAAAPAPYGIDNVVYGGASAYAPARPAAYAPAPAPAYAAVATPNYAVAPSSAYATP
ncbi:MAG: hypothetical protein WB868_01150, partial [Xanthobacteraceae bacterium]